ATEALIKTDGWQGYSFLDASPDLRHQWLVPGSGKEAAKALPWVHTLIANIKGNIRGVHHGVSPKHLPRYLAEFCYRFNRRFWELQMFNRMLHACLNSSSITFSELRQFKIEWQDAKKVTPYKKNCLTMEITVNYIGIVLFGAALIHQRVHGKLKKREEDCSWLAKY